MSSRAVLTALMVLLGGSTAAMGLEEGGVLVLYNVASADSQQIANYYAQVHPNVHLLGLTGVSTAEEISADEYLATVRPQVLTYLNGPGAPEIQCIVTTKGLPLRIYNTHANPGTYPGWRGSVYGISISSSWWKPYSSLESELTRIQSISSWEQMGDQAYFMNPPSFPFTTQHHASNPYYQIDAAFNSDSYEGVYLTSRLDGFTVVDVTASIDRAQYASYGTIIIDDDPNAPAAAADRMPQLSSAMTAITQAASYNGDNNATTTSAAPVGGYVSHGVNDGAGGLSTGYITSQLAFDLSDGAVFQTYESYNAYSFTVGGNRAGQGLLAEWLAAGGTAGVGHVEEPGASSASVANEDILFTRLAKGYTWVEAAWASIRQLSFVNTVIGDPLMTWTRNGDLNGDGRVNDADIDLLYSNLTGSGAPVADPRYDLDGDSDADTDDVTRLVTVTLATAFGDANLDRLVNATDLIVLSQNYGTTGSGWAKGDFNSDGLFNGVDLSIMHQSFGFNGVGDGQSPVPEPSTVVLLIAGGLIGLRRRRR